MHLALRAEVTVHTGKRTEKISYLRGFCNRSAARHRKLTVKLFLHTLYRIDLKLKQALPFTLFRIHVRANVHIILKVSWFELFYNSNSFHIELTNFMELSCSWEAASSAATQELLNILWNPKVYYRVHKSPPLVPVLLLINSVHVTPSYLSKFHFNIIHPPNSWSS
jgi:hypothetical protein